MTEHRIVIDENGDVAAVYSDAIAGAINALGGTVDVTRASHVEPHPSGGWIADMGPSGGPILFSNGEAEGILWRDGLPFRTRAAALAAELAWLRAYRGL